MLTVSCALNSSDSGNIAKLEGRSALHEAGTHGFIDLLEVFTLTILFAKIWP